MARVRYLEREDLAPEHQHLYDEIAASRRGLPPNFKALRWGAGRPARGARAHTGRGAYASGCRRGAPESALPEALEHKVL